ncbi:MAG TPA: rod shape-determining protein MreC [Dehalococcoidia bacterium]|nr:rod shape-determining protein MreC [Dehalococcoidia bacterium]
MRLVWWLATVFGLSVISIFLSQHDATDPVQNLTLTVSAPLQSSLRDLAAPISEAYFGITDRGDIKRENDRLREELETLQNQLAAQQDAQQRVRELEDALGLRQSRPEDTLLAADVIAEEPSGLKRAIAINRGLNDGIDEGMIVLSRAGSVVGTVSRVYDDFAWIRLITDPESAINAQVNIAALSSAPPGTGVLTPEAPSAQASPTPAPTAAPAEPQTVRAVAAGDQRSGIVLDLIPSDAPIATGNLVVTSGLGGNFPRGLLLGTIDTVDERPQAPFKSATIEPSATLSGLETVLVLISFKPARLTGP